MKGDEIVLMVVILVLIASVAATVLTVLNNRHRLDEMKAKAALGAEAEQENELLRDEVKRLHQRLATIETIVTDPAERTAREIEQLR